MPEATTGEPSLSKKRVSRRDFLKITGAFAANRVLPPIKEPLIPPEDKPEFTIDGLYAKGQTHPYGTEAAPFWLEGQVQHIKGISENQIAIGSKMSQIIIDKQDPRLKGVRRLNEQWKRITLQDTPNLASDDPPNLSQENRNLGFDCWDVYFSDGMLATYSNPDYPGESGFEIVGRVLAIDNTGTLILDLGDEVQFRTKVTGLDLPGEYGGIKVDDQLYVNFWTEDEERERIFDIWKLQQPFVVNRPTRHPVEEIIY